MIGAAHFRIRASVAADVAAINALYPLAFPDEDLRPLVAALLSGSLAPLSLVVEHGKSIVGHVVFTECRVAASADRCALLGPLAVAPSHHRQGFGTALVRAGVERLKADGFRAVFVLGDPAYYQRFGFEVETQVIAPYPLPIEWFDAWRSLHLTSLSRSIAGGLEVPPPWRDPALWGAS
ncbi:MAG: N-acetyltransferase [Neomegalonema sp.]|nr:N-acetyltransferase [Neomegalonema sp.]